MADNYGEALKDYKRITGREWNAEEEARTLREARKEAEERKRTRGERAWRRKTYQHLNIDDVTVEDADYKDIDPNRLNAPPKQLK